MDVALPDESAQRLPADSDTRAHDPGRGTGPHNAQIGRELRVKADTVGRWRMRWPGLQAVSLDDLSVSERLQDTRRSDRPAQITAEQICQMIAQACAQPKERPISHWTGREIADEVVAQGIVAQISPRHAIRLLKKGISSRI